MTIENHITIRQPIEDVFAYVADFENVPRWNYFVTHVHQETPGPIGEGTHYHQQRKSDEQHYTITAYDPGHHVTVQTTPDSRPWFERSLTFTPEADGTRIDDHWQLDLGVPWIAEKVAGGRVRNAVAENLGKLKELLETGQTRLVYDHGQAGPGSAR